MCLFAVALVLAARAAHQHTDSPPVLTADTHSMANSPVPPPGGAGAQNTATPLPDCQLHAVQAIREITDELRQRLDAVINPSTGQSVNTDTTLGLGIATQTDSGGNCVWRARIALTGPRPAMDAIQQALATNNNHGYRWIQQQLLNHNPNAVLATTPLRALSGIGATGADRHTEAQLLGWMTSNYPGYQPVVGATTGVCAACRNLILSSDGVIATAISLQADPNTTGQTLTRVDLYAPFANNQTYPWEEIKALLQDPANVISAGALEQALQQLATGTPLIAIDPNTANQLHTTPPQVPVQVHAPAGSTGLPNQADLASQLRTSPPTTSVQVHAPANTTGMPNQAGLASQFQTSPPLTPTANPNPTYALTTNAQQSTQQAQWAAQQAAQQQAQAAAQQQTQQQAAAQAAQQAQAQQQQAQQQVAAQVAAQQALQQQQAQQATAQAQQDQLAQQQAQQLAVQQQNQQNQLAATQQQALQVGQQALSGIQSLGTQAQNFVAQQITNTQQAAGNFGQQFNTAVATPNPQNVGNAALALGTLGLAVAADAATSGAVLGLFAA